jgi:diacylglycerol kinase family enzyme
VTRSSETARNDRIAVVLNGNARSVTDEVREAAAEVLAGGGDLFVSRTLDELATIAETIEDHRYGTVLTGGGDGTFTATVTEVLRICRARGTSPPRFGLLRLGTGNSLAWVVGASRGGRRGVAADIARLRREVGARPMRLVEVEARLAPFCGFGMDASVLADFHAVRDRFRKLPVLKTHATGLASYAVAAVTKSLPDYLSKPMPFVRVTNLGADAWKIGPNGRPLEPAIAAGETIFEGRARLVAASTIPYYGFGFRVFPYADEREDRMNLRLTTLGSVEFIANFGPIWRGEYRNPTSMFDFLVERVRVEIEPAVPFQIGGDAMGDRRSVELALSAEPIQLVDFYAPPTG